MFFKSNKEIKTKDLKLADFDKIWTKFCFLDETVTLSDQKDQYFTVGILKMSQPYYLQSKIFYERSKIRFYDEVKFNKLSKNNVSFAKTIIDTLFETRSISFCSYSISTKSDYYLKRFDKNPWLAYEQITLKLLDATLSEQEIIVLIADHVTTTKDNDLLQLVDLLIGAVTYDIKFSKNLVDGSKYKLEVVDYLKRKLGADSFLKGFKNHNFNIFVDKTDHLDISQNNEANEKGLSS